MTTHLQPGLAPVRQVLSSGAVLLAKEARATPAVAILATVQAGSAGDSAGLPGTAWFLSRVIDRGTTRQTAQAMGEWLDGHGVALQVGVNRHQLVVSCTCLSEDFAPMLQLVGDVLCCPTLPEAEIETRRVEILTSIRQDEDNPAVMAVDAGLRLLYPDGHPYGRRIKGTAEAVARTDRASLAAFHERFVGPSSLVVACVGDVDSGQMAQEAERVFGSWRHRTEPQPVPSTPPAAVRRRESSILMPGKAQCDVAYGFVSLARRDPAYHAFTILNNVLGQYALGGRLGDSIRERQGMAYYVYSVLEASTGAGPLLIRAGVSPANVERTIASIDDELHQIAKEGVTPAEMEASRTYLRMSMPRALETNAGIAQFLQTCEQFGLGLDYDVRLPALLDGVALDEVTDLARRFFVPERAAIAVAGPGTGARDDA